MYPMKLFLFFGITTLNLHTILTFDPCNNKYELVTDLMTDADCGEGFFYLPHGNPVHNCFPRCFPKYDLKTTPCNANNPCPQGYTCLPSNEGTLTFCLVDNASCFKYYTKNEENNKWQSALWKPECLPGGAWAPKQCKGEATNGRCFCYDANGNRIFGEAMVQDSADMTCACSRKRSEQTNLELHIYPEIHCDRKGNYEPLQCEKGHCWCVNQTTGEITSKIVTEAMMMLLPCYNKAEIGERYLRQCESEKHAQEVVSKELKIHGTEYANFKPILCDGDGAYGSYKIDSGVIYCTWRDNSPIDNYISTVDDKSALVNCNCARDKKLYEERGQKQTLVCSPNGNYRPTQQVNMKWYCVDQDGFRKSDYFDTIPTDCDQYY